MTGTALQLRFDSDFAISFEGLQHVQPSEAQPTPEGLQYVQPSEVRPMFGRLQHARATETSEASDEPKQDTHASLRSLALHVPPAVSEAPIRETFQALQEWEGTVLDIGDKVFTARLIDVTADQKFATEMGEFPIEDIGDDDMELLKPGAIFRWSIGYLRSRGGTKRRLSQIVFRRLPVWTKADLEQARQRAGELSRTIAWE